MENEKQFQKKLKSLQTIDCEFKEDHNEDYLTLVCTDQRCKPSNQYLNPMCNLCQEKNVHQKSNHKENNLRSFIKDLVNMNDKGGEQSSFQKQLNEKKIIIIEDLKIMKKDLTLAQGSIDQIIEQINNTLKSIDKLFEIDITEQLSQIANSTNYENYKISLEKLDKYIDITHKQQEDDQKQYEIKLININQNRINHIQKLVDTFQIKFTELSQQTLKYSEKFQNDSEKFQNDSEESDQGLQTIKKFEFKDWNEFKNTPFETYREANHLILEFNDNSIGDDGAVSISEGIRKLDKLTNLHLDLGSNSIGKDGAISISEGLIKLDKLTNLHLDLGDNSIGDDGAVSISEGIRKLDKLTNLHLGLFENNISYAILQQIEDLQEEIKNKNE